MHGFPARVSLMQRGQGGKVSKDEAQALLKQAGSDGKISSAELSFLQSKVQKPLFQLPMFEKVGEKLQLRPRQDEFDADAQARSGS